MPVPVAVEEDRVVPVDMERDQVVLVAVEEDQVVPVAVEEDQVVQVVVEENEALDVKYRAVGVVKDPTVIKDQALIALKKINRAMGIVRIFCACSKQPKCIRACHVE